MLHVEATTVCEGALVDERFRLDKVLGEGAMGVVWAATDTVTDEPRALKFVRAERALDARSQARLSREASALLALAHPNIVKVFGLHELPDGSAFFVMERLRGETLRARIERRGPLDVGAAIGIARSLASALACAHAAGVVHRDLKPENVFVTEGGELKVLDFGVAKAPATGQTGPSLTSDGSMLGTLHYMAPEQVFGDEDLDGRADVWGLGVLVYECVAGKRPTEAGGSGQVLKAIMVKDFAPLSEVVPGCPRALSELVASMLARERSSRPTASEVDARLSAIAAGDGKPRAQSRAIVLTLLGAGVVGGIALAYASRSTAPRASAPPSASDLASTGSVAAVASDRVAPTVSIAADPSPPARPSSVAAARRPPVSASKPAAAPLDPAPASIEPPPPAALSAAPSSAAPPLSTSRL